MEILVDCYYFVVFDYLGFGFSDMLVVEDFGYSFDCLVDVVEGFCDVLGLDCFVVYLFDFGVFVGLCLVECCFEWIVGFVI